MINGLFWIALLAVLALGLAATVIAVKARAEARRMKATAAELAEKNRRLTERLNQSRNTLMDLVRDLPQPAYLLDRTSGVVVRASQATPDPERTPERSRWDIVVAAGEFDLIFPQSTDDSGEPNRRRNDREHKVVRSVLNEPNVVKGLEKAAALLVAGEVISEAGFAVTLLDEQTRHLRLLWQTGMVRGVQRLLDNAALVFGQIPSANAALLAQDIRASRAAASTSAESLFVLPAEVAEWQSYPIRASSGEVLGTFDWVLPKEGDGLVPAADRVANFLFVASVLLERHRAMEVVVHRSRTDRLVSRISELLISSSAGAEQEALVESLGVLQGSDALSVGAVGLVFQSSDGPLVRLGSLFTAAVPLDHDLPWLKAQLLPFIDSRDHLDMIEGVGGLPRLIALPSLDDAAGRHLVSALGLSLDETTASLVIFPLFSGSRFDGALLFGNSPEVSGAQGQLLSLVAPLYTSHIDRTGLLAELERRANVDLLTGLCNRGHTEQVLQSEIDRSRRYRNALSVVMFDIDHFKSINDTHGHDAGDRVLKEIARRVTRALRNVDVFGRWGGEEFLVILTETPADNAEKVAENVRRAVEEGQYGLPVPVTVSVGIAGFRENDTTETLVKRADEALYGAKSGGRNQVRRAG